MPVDTFTLTEQLTCPIFSLWQISDPYFPIGGYTQSFGLETYVQKGIVHNAESARQYLNNFLCSNFLYNDLLTVRLAWEYAGEEHLENIVLLDQTLSAAKAAREIRSASLKLGNRFLKIVKMVLGDNQLFKDFMHYVRKGRQGGHYSVVFGLCARLLNIDKRAAVAAISYSTASSIINNCAKLVPISQQDGQKILFASHAVLREVLDRVEDLMLEDIGVCGMGFDVRAMQHERLYTRLYIS